MSEVRICKSNLYGEVLAPSSKSHMHRLLLLSLLSSIPITIYGNLNGDDIAATRRFLSALGVRETLGDGLTLVPPEAYPDSITVDVGESGSTLRFAIPICAALGVNAGFYGKGRLASRPLTGLTECLKKAGVKVTHGKFPITVEGRMQSAELCLDASESSQYLTGILYALAVLGGGKVSVTGGSGSGGYVDMTVDTLEEYGFSVCKEGSVYTVKKENVISNRIFTAEGDWSGACFWVVGALLNGDVSVRGLRYPSAQPDCAIVDILRRAGGNIEYSDGKLVVKKSTLGALSFNADGCPDLVPVTAVALAAANGRSIIEGVSRLRLKESDRVSSVVGMLRALGVDVDSDTDSIVINGGRAFSGGRIQTFGDHRIAMSGAIAATVADGETYVDNGECVAKSYADFWQDYKLLGGKSDEQ